MARRFLSSTPPRQYAKSIPHATMADLPEQQRAVLNLIAQGLPNRDIADELFISLDTVKTHVRRLMDKTGARDRTHLVAMLYEGEHLSMLGLDELVARINDLRGKIDEVATAKRALDLAVDKLAIIGRRDL